MYTEVMKRVSIVALLLAVLFWPSAPTYQTVLNVVVSIAAAVVLTQAFKAKNYRWVAGFLSLALLFNPLMPVFRLVGSFSLLLVVLAIVPFVISLVALRPFPLLVDSINHGSESRKSVAISCDAYSGFRSPPPIGLRAA